MTVLNYDTFRRLETSLLEPTRVLSGVNGDRLGVHGEAKVKICSNRKSVNTVVSVVRGARRNLLGN